MLRKEIYPVNLVLPFVFFVPKDVGNIRRVDFDGDLINMASDRYQTFSQSCRCAACEIEGIYFAKERHASHNTKNFHFNLYAIDDAGTEVLMTKDHILPHALGGHDDLSNYQTMCYRCNEKKRHQIGTGAKWMPMYSPEELEKEILGILQKKGYDIEKIGRLISTATTIMGKRPHCSLQENARHAIRIVEDALHLRKRDRSQ